jgi:hypothetical protein
MSNQTPSRVEDIGSLIRTIRGQKVILDSDLARIYGVPTKRLNEQVGRNAKRFPHDFLFQLTAEEAEILKSQFATSSSHGGRRKLPYAFTENGAIMAANVLNSPEAVRMSVFVVRAFIKMRDLLGGTKELARQLADLEIQTACASPREERNLCRHPRLALPTSDSHHPARQSITV